LLDSSFTTIVDAIEEWRGMFDNIRKIILYLMCDAFVQIIAILIALLTWNPHPMTAAQILWNNLVSDGPPSLAMTVDPKRKWLMNEPPRNPKIQLISRWIMELIGIVSLSAAVVWFLLFVYVLDQTNDLVLARSVAFACFGLTTVLYVYSVRTLKKPLRTESPLNNLWLLFAWVLDLWLVVAPYFIKPLGDFLDVVSIWYRRWYAIACALGVVVIIEISKAYLKNTAATH
jgi:Ca2+-transporting ATPase